MTLDNKYTRAIFTYIFPIIMADYYLIMRGVNLNAVVLPVYAVLSVIAIILGFKRMNDSFIKSMNAFLVYTLFTAVFYLFNDVPFSCYVDTLRSFLFPIAFAYLGYYFSTDYSFNKWYLIGCAFCFLMGFYLYITIPSYYTQFLVEMRSNTWYIQDGSIDESNIMDIARFSSFFTTSYAISCLSIPSLVLSLSLSFKNNSGLAKGWCYIIALSSFIAAMLCQQRIAIAFSIIILLFFIIYSSRLTNSRNRIVLAFYIIIIVVFLVFLVGEIANSEWFERISNLVGMRFDEMNFSKAMSERTSQYSSFDRATDLSYIFGLGLGSCGHAAGAAGFKSINDGEFVKLFYEFGVFGCALLALVVIPALIRGIKHFKLFYAEVLIIVFYLASGIAADSLTFFIFSIMFWYSLGRIWNKEYYLFLKQERLQRYGVTQQ